VLPTRFSSVIDLIQVLQSVPSRSLILAVPALLASIFCASCQQNVADIAPLDPPKISIPPGFPQPFVPADDPWTPAKTELGRYLFYSPELSGNEQFSCASCHKMSAAFCDPGQHWSFGSTGQHGSRNTLSLLNLAYDTCFFWDGRAKSLEEQALEPIFNPIELDNDSATLILHVKRNSLFSPLFIRAFGSDSVTMTRIAQALASFERTLISGTSAYDAFRLGDSEAISESAKRGLALFSSKSINCIACHSGINFTDNGYHSNGLDLHYLDAGLENLTNDPDDNGKFRTPTLRNVALTAPYMHDGRFSTLEQVLDFYNRGGMHNPTQDSLIHPLELSGQQMEDIIAFLATLTDSTCISRNSFSNPFQ